MNAEANRVEDALWELCGYRGWAFGVHISTAHECAWSCEVRLTPKPNQPDAPDVSRVFFSTGGGDADEVFVKAGQAALDWAATRTT